MGIRIGARIFAPSLLMTVLTVLASAAFVSLGFWQWTKGNLRQAEAREFARGTEQAVPLGSRGLGDVARFQRVKISGTYDPSRQFLLDNRTHLGRPGYEVLTPLEREAGPAILVDRGWVPFTGFRDRLPNLSFTAPPSVEVIGRVAELPSEGLASGRAPPDAGTPWPKVTAYPHAAELSAALGEPVEPRILLLDAGEPNGYVRDWQPPGMPAIRHWSYAVQWWGFAVLAVALWLILGMRKDRIAQ